MRPIIAAAALIALPLTVPAIAQVASTPGMPGTASTKIAAGTYQVDPAHTQVTWTVNHMGFSMLQGQFGASEGSITIDRWGDPPRRKWMSPSPSISCR